MKTSLHQVTSRPRAQGRRRRSLLSLLAATLGVFALPAPAEADGPVEDVFDLLDDQLLPSRNTGGGSSFGAMTYVGKKLPRALSVCETGLTFQLGDGQAPPPGQADDGWMSDAFVFNTVISGYAGPVSMTGTGNSDTSCESYSLGGGVVTVALEGFNELTASRLDCRDSYGDLTKSASLRGRYTRVLSDMTVVLTGRCLVNDFATGQVTFIARLQATPAAGSTEGVTSSVERLTTTGVFMLVPA